LERSLRKLRRLNRQIARCTPGSNHRKASRRKLARVHARAANLRRDALHKLTTTLATQHGIIVVEQLNLAGMVRNRRLARSLADASLAELRRQLAYKTSWYSSRLLVADRFYPSSKTCSACGWVKAKLTLAERTFTCEACGLRLDRDLNAARNLATLAEHVAQSGWETSNAPWSRPEDPACWAGGQEAGSRRRILSGRTGTGRYVSADLAELAADHGRTSPTVHLRRELAKDCA
jgi:putative transposase